MIKRQRKISAKANALFRKARLASAADNFEAAINLYLQALRLEPEQIEGGHVELREMSVRREQNGGAKPSPDEQVKYSGGRRALDKMLNVEYLLAKDPGHMPYAEVILKAAVEGGYNLTAKWIADLIFLANNNAANPVAKLYILLKDSYAAIDEFDRAVSACTYALKLLPKQEHLIAELKKLIEARDKAGIEAAEQILGKIEQAGASEKKDKAAVDENKDGDKAMTSEQQAERHIGI